MAAKIVVIVENQNSRVRIFRAPEVRSSEPTDAAAHDHQIVDFLGVERRGIFWRKFAVSHTVRCFERALVAPAQSCQFRRVVSMLILSGS